MKCRFAAVALLVLAAVAAAQDFQPLQMNQGDCETYTGLWFCPKFTSVSQLYPTLMTVRYATVESVTGGAAIRVEIKKGSTGAIGYEIQDNTLMPDSAGLTFYAKAAKPVEIEVSGRTKVSVGTDWKKFDLPWEKLNTTAAKPDLSGELVLALATPADEDCWIIYDRIGSEKSFTKPQLTPQPGPDKTINTAELVGNAKAIAPTLAKLKDKKPVRIYVIGDSVSWGAQKTRGSPALGNKVDDFLYFNHLARLLKTHFGYEQITTENHSRGGRAAADLVRALDGKPRNEEDKTPFDGLQEGDLLIIELGTNDLNRAMEDFKSDDPQHVEAVKIWLENTKRLLNEARKKTDQIVILSPTAGPSTLEYGPQASEEIRKFAEREKVAYFDVIKWSGFRGPNLGYGYLSNFFHPDVTGHMMMGQILATLFTDEHFMWPPYAAVTAKITSKTEMSN